jgi:hypothetical protein
MASTRDKSSEARTSLEGAETSERQVLAETIKEVMIQELS